MKTQREREDKFTVPATWALPDLEPLVPPGGTLDVETRRLESVYHDTAADDLRRFGVTLRRRSGDEGLGWQLKVPEGTTRLELHSGSRHRTPPADLVRVVSGVAGGHGLGPVARLTTARTAHRILTADGTLVAEIVDDHVDSATLGPESTLDSWREIEVELGPAGDESFLTAAGRLLSGAGAQPVVSTKLERALGRTSATPVTNSRPPKRLGALIRRYVAEQCGVLIGNDLRLRAAQRLEQSAELVHKTRVAVRRLRSTVRVFGDAFEPTAAAALEADLVWYAGLLGAVRDLDIVEHRIETELAGLPPELVLGPVSSVVQEIIAARRSLARRQLAEALGSERYLALLGTVRVWQSEPPLTDLASAKAARVSDLVKAARRKARRRERAAGDDTELLHRARKATKRARYAAELASPVDPKAHRRAAEAEGRQELLGEHQDAVLTAEILLELGAVAGARDDQNGFTLGVLYARQVQRAAEVRAAVHRQR